MSKGLAYLHYFLHQILFLRLVDEMILDDEINLGFADSPDSLDFEYLFRILIKFRIEIRSSEVDGDLNVRN